MRTAMAKMAAQVVATSSADATEIRGRVAGTSTEPMRARRDSRHRIGCMKIQVSDTPMANVRNKSYAGIANNGERISRATATRLNQCRDEVATQMDSRPRHTN